MRERGLKFFLPYYSRLSGQVAPHAGAWIEISIRRYWWKYTYVAPHAGAWIEIPPSPPHTILSNVAPHAGAWIEILIIFLVL